MTSAATGSRPQSSRKYDVQVKLLVLGDSDVGKGSLVLRFAEGKYDPNLRAAEGIDFKVKLIDDFEGTGKRVKIQVWDTAGQERFHTVTTSYYRGCDCVLIVYDVSNRESFDHVRNWRNELNKHASEDAVNRVLVGNKCECLADKRAVSEAEGAGLAAELGMKFFETSVRDDVNVQEAFHAAAAEAVERIERTGGRRKAGGGGGGGGGVRLEGGKKNGGGKCC